MPDEWTLGRLLAWTTDYLKGQGAESPRLDAEILLAAAHGCQRIQLYTSFDEPADETTRQRFRELVRRRAEGTPVAYLVGHKEFYSLSFRVTPDVRLVMDAGLYQHTLTNGAPGPDWTQRRASMRIEWMLGRDPGMAAGRMP